jgi:hypothetical protein
MRNGQEQTIQAEGQPIAVNPVVTLLEQVLAAAKAGQIDTVALAAVSPIGAFQTSYVGGRRGDLYIALELLRHKVLSDIANPPERQRSGIVRPPAGMSF